MSGQPVKRIVYLNGEDTGLTAWSPSHATLSLFMVLRKRGDDRVTPEALKETHTTQKGRVDFTWPRTPA